MPFRILPTMRDYTVSMIAECGWLTVIGCDNKHAVRWTGADLIARFPLDATSGQIADRLVCSICGSREGGVGFLQDNSPAALKRRIRKDLDTAPTFKRR